MSELGSEIFCRCCGENCKDFFEYVVGEKVPDYFYNGMTWYCSISCYDEGTLNE